MSESEREQLLNKHSAIEFFFTFLDLVSDSKTQCIPDVTNLQNHNL